MSLAMAEEERQKRSSLDGEQLVVRGDDDVLLMTKETIDDDESEEELQLLNKKKKRKVVQQTQNETAEDAEGEEYQKSVDVTSKVGVDDGWECSICTLVNRNMSLQCEACGEIRPTTDKTAITTTTATPDDALIILPDSPSSTTTRTTSSSAASHHRHSTTQPTNKLNGKDVIVIEDSPKRATPPWNNSRSRDRDASVSCRMCTYLNEPGRTICAMCNSRL